MYWYKVKTLLIWLFAAINIFLIIFIVNGKVQQNIYEKSEITSLIKVLENNGIKVSRELLTGSGKEVRMATVENLTPAGDELAKKLLGEGYTAFSAEGQGQGYMLGNKVLTEEGGKFTYRDYDLVSDKEQKKDNVEAVRIALGKYGIDLSNAVAEVMGDKFVFTYYFDGLPLFENTFFVKMAGEKIAEMGGYILSFKESGDEEIKTSSPKDAAALFLRDINREEGGQEIVSVSLGYSALLADSSVHFKNTETIPTYKITTNKNKVYYYDAR